MVTPTKTLQGPSQRSTFHAMHTYYTQKPFIQNSLLKYCSNVIIIIIHLFIYKNLNGALYQPCLARLRLMAPSASRTLMPSSCSHSL